MRSTNQVVFLVPDGTQKASALECPHFAIEQTAGRSKLTASLVDYEPLATFNDWQKSGSSQAASHAPFVMSIAIQTYPVMPTRPCSFCLCLQGGSVFADFDADDNSIISLRRISFDGYGCCKVGESITKMSSGDSRLFLDAIARGELESIEVEEVLRRYFRENKDMIWSDALAEHDLL